MKVNIASFTIETDDGVVAAVCLTAEQMNTLLETVRLMHGGVIKAVPLGKQFSMEKIKEEDVAKP